MAKIYTPVQDYSGYSAGVKFDLGVGVSTNAVAIAWFKAHGYTVVDDILDLATLDKLNKDVLMEIATQLTIVTTNKTKKDLVEAIRALFIVQAVSVTSSKTLSLEVDATSQITTSIDPETAYNKSLLYASSDDTKATVSDTGLITAIAEGTATITITAAGNEDASDTIEVTVITGT